MSTVQLYGVKSTVDKYEYQVCAEQIKSLIAQHRFAEAMDIADTIDWRRVRNLAMLCTVSEIYKANRHYDESRDILLLAYERYPDQPNVVYALCELSVKLDNLGEAVEFYKEYVHLRPSDTSRYVLLYKIYDAQGVPLEDKISLLEEFKKAEYTERWAYELALMYHKIGMESKCVAECDELILWFNDGPYVRKAMELKMQHTQLTTEQQHKYEGKAAGSPVVNLSKPQADGNVQSEADRAFNSQNTYLNGSQGQVGYPGQGYSQQSTPSMQYPGNNQQAYQNQQYQNQQYQNQQYQGQQAYQNQAYVEQNNYIQPSYVYQDIQVQPVNTDKFSTLNLQEELAKNMEEFYSLEQPIIEAPYYGETAQLFEPSQQQYLQNLQQYGHQQFGTQPVYISGASTPAQLYPDMIGNNSNADSSVSSAPSVDNEQQTQEPQIPKVSMPTVKTMSKVDVPTRITGQLPGSDISANDSATSEPLQMSQEPVNDEVPVINIRNQSSITEGNIDINSILKMQETRVEDTVNEKVSEPENFSTVPDATMVIPKIAENVTESEESTDFVPLSKIEHVRRDESSEETIVRTSEETEAQGSETTETGEDALTAPVESLNDTVIAASDDAQSTGSEAVCEKTEEEKRLEKVLAQESDGQISLSLPEEKLIEKQITGQIDISDFLKEWNAKKQSVEAERKERIMRRSLEQTSDIMAQLVGVIPGMDMIAHPELKEKQAHKPIIPVNEVEVPQEIKNMVSHDSVSAPTMTGFDVREDIYPNIEDTGDEEVKRTESGSKINGPRISAVTGAIPSVLPSGRMMTLEEEYGGNIAQVRKDDEELVKRMTGEIDTDDVEEAVSDVEEVTSEEVIPEIEAEDQMERETFSDNDTLSDERFSTAPFEEGIVGEVETVKATDVVEAETPVFEEDEEGVEEIEDIDVKELPEEFKEEPQLNSFGDEEPEIDTEEGIPSLEEESKEEDSLEEEPDGDEAMEEEEAEESNKYPYEVEDGDYGEIEEIETIDQPDDLEDMMKTGKLPVSEVSSAEEYGGGMDGAFPGVKTQEAEKEEVKSSRPSYMVLDETVHARRDFDEDELEIFGRFDGIESVKAQIVDAVDDMSMEPGRGNVVVTGSERYGRKGLAIDVVKAMQRLDSEFSGKVAKISGEALNKKNIPMTLAKLKGGALVVENAGSLTPITVNTITDTLIHSADPLLIVLEGDNGTIDPLLIGCTDAKKVFNARIAISDFSSNDLVAYGIGYAKELGYSVDDMGTLALHERIGDLETIDHVVCVEEVKDIVDEAIHHVDRKNMSHFMDVLVGKRYDDDDCIVLREKDFLN